MVYEPAAFDLSAAALSWVAAVSVLTLVVLVIGLIGAVLSGGLDGLRAWAASLAGAAADLVLAAPGKVWAVALLTFRESVRQKALYVFAVFAVLFMFAGWFLGADAGGRSADNTKVYVSFVLTVMSWLTLLVMLVLSCWGLPEDIRRRSLHTVVTKPARRSEIVLGRMLGYTLIGTLLLAVMGVAGYVWIDRRADATLTARRPIFIRSDRMVLNEETGRLYPGNPGLLFYGRDGEPTTAGLNVGNVWEYRSYIDGASKMKAEYRFAGITPDVTRDVKLERVDEATGEVTLEDGRVLQFESDFEGFRTVKGDMTRGLQIQFAYLNPETGTRVTDPQVIYLDEFDGNVHNLPETFTAFDPDAVDVGVDPVTGEEVETRGAVREWGLFESPPHPDGVDRRLVSTDGQLTVEVRSLDPMQLLGLGRGDLFIRPPDGSFAASYASSVFAVWLKMVLVVLLGVTAGTFVKRPVATLLVFTLLIIGTKANEFLEVLLAGAFDESNMDGFTGGGPVESTVRILTHANTVRELPDSPLTTLVQGLDTGLLWILWALTRVVPDFSAFDTAAITAEGFAVPFYDTLLPAIGVVVAFLLPCYVIGTLSLRSRELEAK